ncbi:hypothetical protein AB0J52_18425 [Spirillospora sp. NPDC049652]
MSLVLGIVADAVGALDVRRATTERPRRANRSKEAGFAHERFALYVWRSVRKDGDTKTEKSRRTLELPEQAAEALKTHHARQAAQKLKAGESWQNNDLVFCSPTGTPLDAANVRRAFRLITKKAKLGEHQGCGGHQLRVRSRQVRVGPVQVAPRLAPRTDRERKKGPGAMLRSPF